MKPTESFLDFLAKMTVAIPPIEEIDFRGSLYLFTGRHYTEL